LTDKKLKLLVGVERWEDPITLIVWNEDTWTPFSPPEEEEEEEEEEVEEEPEETRDAEASQQLLASPADVEAERARMAEKTHVMEELQVASTTPVDGLTPSRSHLQPPLGYGLFIRCPDIRKQLSRSE
jgi:hypothetical protein